MHGGHPCSGQAATASWSVRGAIIGPEQLVPIHLVGKRTTAWPHVGHSPFALAVHRTGRQSHDQALRRPAGRIPVTVPARLLVIEA